MVWLLSRLRQTHETLEQRVDDHPLVREWLANVINQQGDLTVCGESEGRKNCVEAIQKKKPHVAIVVLEFKK